MTSWIGFEHAQIPSVTETLGAVAIFPTKILNNAIEEGYRRFGGKKAKSAKRGHDFRRIFIYGRPSGSYSFAVDECSLPFTGDCPNFRGGEDLLLEKAAFRRENGTVPFGRTRRQG
jgi:hypothetical protein